MIKINKKGTTLIITYLVITVLLILGIAFTARSITESRIAERQKIANQAFYIAEAGLERALRDLKSHFEHSPAPPSWEDETVYTSATETIDLTQGGTVTIPPSSFYDLPYGTTYDSASISTSLGSGSFAVELANTGNDNEIWVRSTGTAGDISKTLQAYVKIENSTPWTNAVFAGAGQSGNTIDGNVDIRGSVHILATSLEPGQSAMVLAIAGTGYIGNNYDGMDADLSSRIPHPQVTYKDELVESLGATVRVKRGSVSLEGNADIGKEDAALNPYKETVDAFYVTDGYSGQGDVYSDNGTGNPYDLGDSVQFPSLSDPHPDEPGSSYLDYFASGNHSYLHPSDLNITVGTPIDPALGDANGQIFMDGDGNLQISGTVYIDGNLTIEGGPITYTGKGTIVSTGNVLIKSSLVTPATGVTFPDNAIGIMTPNNITLGEASQLDIMGIFYAENTIAINKQTKVVGSVVANYFDMGDDVPKIYHVPEISTVLPTGMISETPLWVTSTSGWQEM